MIDILTILKIVIGIIILISAFFIIRRYQKDRTAEYDKADTFLLILVAFELVILPIWGYLLYE